MFERLNFQKRVFDWKFEKIFQNSSLLLHSTINTREVNWRKLTMIVLIMYRT